ncbi:hypothetical protein [Pseudanabaena yagii]|uniref:GUN4-like domain-containing protein n=1 Tax=Pseudanabaena yagii GIHE-NHR1 TaxID=2722753 RepID=A0ABX1LV63_9CYAN|nr:hypothetical protein [Pseudanabaena yagii]NMF57702.1 hypothetical protein [Pseudanabaena yagii GIHE-NHR1]NMF58041.1 hypothetical protein [Pseudanabaena yagii GIHE-NHR1]NMF58419.1 hypothetical protein [Pseudanabaena yagii GIHE-NHR1]NMF60065.1 hypothetical protein [Pseudanabaena yagii GIHE-NHR1]
MSQLETLQDIYSKIADIYDKFCNLGSDAQSSVLYNVTILDNSWNPPSIQLDNPDSLQEISQAQQEVNEAISATFTVIQSIENEYVQALGDNSIIPYPNGGALVWLPKLIAILVGYKAPVKFIASLIIDFLKEILLEEIKKRLNRKKQYLYGTISLSASASFQIPYDAESLVIIAANIPDWYGKRFNSSDSNLEKYYSLLGTLSTGFKTEGSDNVYWNSDKKVEYKSQWFDLSDLSGVYRRYGSLYLSNQVTATVKFMRSI